MGRVDVFAVGQLVAVRWGWYSDPMYYRVVAVTRNARLICRHRNGAVVEVNPAKARVEVVDEGGRTVTDGQGPAQTDTDGQGRVDGGEV